MNHAFKALLIICVLFPVLACSLIACKEHGTELPKIPPEPTLVIGDNKTVEPELDPDPAMAAVKQGLAQMAKNASGSARESFNRAIALNPNLSEAYCYRAINNMESGATYTERASWAGVFADCNKAIELKPGLAKAYEARGFAYYKNGENSQALADYDRSVELDPNDSESRYHRGLLHYHSKNWNAAIVDFSKSLELDPTGIQVQYYRGTIYRLRGEWDSAIADLEAVAARASIAWPEPRQELAEAYYQRGIAYISQGERSRAIADFNKTIELSDDAELKAYTMQKLKELGAR